MLSGSTMGLTKKKIRKENTHRSIAQWNKTEYQNMSTYNNKYSIFEGGKAKIH